MLKFDSFPTLKQAFYSFYGTHIRSRNIKKLIKENYAQFLMRNEQEKSHPIMKITFEQFQDQKCLGRWGSVSDYEFGGQSKADVFFNTTSQSMILKGIIDISQKDRLQTVPFIGMIQKTPFIFRKQCFNCLRVKLIGDGKPIICQLQAESYLHGSKTARGIILSQKSNDYITYELPFRNFQIKGEESRSILDLRYNDVLRMSQLIDQSLNQSELQISRISFRLQSIVQQQRQVEFKKIELVSSIRGVRQSMRHYLKPYFYIVDEKQTKDQLLKSINIGPYEFTKTKK